jgi:hypothetical protein
MKPTFTALLIALTLAGGGIASAQTAPAPAITPMPLQTPLPIVTPAPMTTPVSIPSSLPPIGPLAPPAR